MPAPQTSTDAEKRLAAERSLDYIQDGMCLGLGSGSTAAIMLELLGRRIRDGLRVQGVPTSEVSRRLAADAGIPLIGFDTAPLLDLTIDGADEVDPQLNLIKGGGGALLREKVVASLSRRVVIIADSSKRVEQLGRFPLPVEVLRFAWEPLAGRLEKMGCRVRLRRDGQGQPLITDEGNYILICDFGKIEDPFGLACELDAMPGVMEHGLFVNLADVMIVGRGDDIVVMEREHGNVNRMAACSHT